MESKSYLIGGFVGISITIALNLLIGPKDRIPSTSEVQSGYAIPSKLEIDVQDLDGIEGNETYLKYDGKQYLLRLDEQGRPRVQSYEIRPSELIIKE